VNVPPTSIQKCQGGGMRCAISRHALASGSFCQNRGLAPSGLSVESANVLLRFFSADRHQFGLRPGEQLAFGDGRRGVSVVAELVARKLLELWRGR
jgi:hypothetical protein